MWKYRLDILIPLTKMTSKKATWNWNKENQKAFEYMIKSISRESSLVYPNFSSHRCQQGTTWGNNLPK